MRELLFKCPICSKCLAVNSAGVGKTIKCTDCRSALKIPGYDLEFKCPQCAQDLCSPILLAGVSLTCPECRTTISIPNDKAIQVAEYGVTTGGDATNVHWFDDHSKFKFRCPACSQKLEGTKKMLGKAIACPVCVSQINLPKAPPVT